MTAPDAAGAPTSPPGAGRPVNLFYSYAREDEALRDELAEHLRILERRGLIASWHDRRIAPGQAWAGEIDRALEAADLVLLLVSSDFIDSQYIFDVELARAMARHAAQACEVVPVIVRPVDIDPDDAEALPFLKLQGLPPDLKPVTSWPNRDEAWTQVAKGLRATVKRLQARWAASAATTALPRRSGAMPPDAMPQPSGADAPTALPPPPRSVAFDRIRPPSGPEAAGAGPEAAGAEPPIATAAADAAPPTDDPLIDRVVDRVAAALGTAAQVRGVPLGPAGVAQVRQEAGRLIDVTDARRVLWVDDRPDNNERERAALSALQIEVVTATSTAEALDRVRAADAAGEPFDLVVSDWSRPWEGAAAALQLVQALRSAGAGMPVVVYHLASDDAERTGRAARLRAAGVVAEAVQPDELLRRVREVLAS